MISGHKNKIDTVHTVTQTFMIFACFEYLGYKSRFYGVMVSTLDFESSDPGSNPGRTSLLVWRARGATTLVRRRRVASHAMASMAQLAERSAVNR